jgi:branched-subunit amino acid ABC-type transport system permease component
VTLLEDIVAFGLYTSALLAIGAVGFTLQFGITNVLNLAFGAILTSSIFVDYWATRGSPSVWLALLCGAVWGALFSLVLGRYVVSAFVRRGTSQFGMAMVTIAVGLVIQFTLEAIQGPTILSYNVAQNHTIKIGAVVMSDLQLIIIGCAAVALVVVHVLLRYTRLGLAMRATASDADLSRGCGIPSGRIRNVAWLVSGALCGVCGVLLGLTTGSFDSTIGGGLFITIAAAAIIGGIGKPYGAMVGALIVGVAGEAAAALISPAYKNVFAWAILIVALVLRPQGIFSEYASERKLVQ